MNEQVCVCVRTFWVYTQNRPQAPTEESLSGPVRHWRLLELGGAAFEASRLQGWASSFESVSMRILILVKSRST